MLPMPPEYYQRRNLDFFSWETLPVAYLHHLLAALTHSPLSGDEQVTASDLVSETMRSYEDWDSTRQACLQSAYITDQFLVSDKSSDKYSIADDPLTFMDKHLSTLGFLSAQTENDDGFLKLLQLSLGSYTINRYEAILAQMLDSDPQNKSTPYLNRREAAVTSIILRNVASYGLWRAIEESKKSQVSAKRETKPRAYVGAVALDAFGKVLQTAYRGEQGELLSRHAEDILIRKMEIANIGVPAIVAVNLEPCKTRSDKHKDLIGHTNGCSTLLAHFGVPIVAYIITDTNRKGSGTGSSVLEDENVLVYQANNPVAIAVSRSIQRLPHLQYVERNGESNRKRHPSFLKTTEAGSRS